MVAGRIGALGTPAELKQQFGAASIDELFVRLARPTAGGAPHEARSRGLLRKEVYHILRDRRTLVVIIAAAGRAGGALRLRDPHRRRRRAARDRRPVAGPGDAGAAQPLRARPACSASSRSCRATDDARAAVPARRGAGRGRVRARLRRAARRAACRRRLLIIADATEPNTGSIVQAYARAVDPGATSSEQRRRAARRASASCPSVRMRFNPTRESSNLFVPGPDGVRADDHLVADDGDLAHAREGDRHDGGAARLAAAAVADHRRQGRAVSRRRLRRASSACIVEARLVFHVPLRGSLAAAARRGRCCSSSCRCRSAS